MTIDQIVALLVALFFIGIAIALIGVLSNKPQEQTRGFAIDPTILRSGRHLPTSRSQEAEFINRAQ